MRERKTSQLSAAKPVIIAAIYARYSSEMQASTSARDQIERIKSLADTDQIESRLHPDAKVQVASEWVLSDEAVSGKVAGRRGYQMILGGIRRKAFDLLIVDDFSRLSRSVGDLNDLYRLLTHFGIELISISDRVSSADPNAKTLFQVKGMIADLGNDAHSERTLRGLESRARDCFSTGPRPFGYTSEATRKEQRKGREVCSHFKILKCPEQAMVVRRIFELYASGYGKRYIAKSLNADKVPTPRRQPSGWNEGLIFNLLTNEKYIGRWIFRKHTYSVNPDTERRVKKLLPRNEWIVSTREDLQIVPQELWEKVQNRLQDNRRVRREASPGHRKVFAGRRQLSDRHLLSGAMTCSKCGMGIVIVSGRRTGYYGCFSAHRQGTCSAKYLLPRIKAETAFINHLRNEVLSNDQIVGYATDAYNKIVRDILAKAPNRRLEITTELSRLDREIQNLIKVIAGGGATDLVTIPEAIRVREDRKSKLSEELRRLEGSRTARPLVTPYMVRDRISGYIGRIIDKGERYNEAIRNLLHGTISVDHQGDMVTLDGQLDLGTTLGGSIHCEIARPA